MMKMKLIRKHGDMCLVSIGRTTKWIDEDAYETLYAAYRNRTGIGMTVADPPYDV